MVGLGGAISERISRRMWDKGCDGCNRNTVGGVFVLLVPSCRRSKGRISLNRCDDVGDNFPIKSESDEHSLGSN